MMLAIQTPGTKDIVFGLLAYTALFALTIWQYRKNRGIVLGVVTVAVFFGFLLLADLRQAHAAAWQMVTLASLIMLTGFILLGFVAVDIFNWAARKRTLDTSGKDPRTPSAPGAK